MEAPQFIAAIRSSLRRTLVLDGISRVVGWGLLTALAIVLLDRFNSLPGVVRLILLVALVAVVVTVAWRRLIRPLSRRMGDQVIARIAERRIPQLDGRLFSAVDGIELGPRDREVLATACNDDSAGRIVRSDGMVRALTGASLLATALLGLALLYPAAFGIGLRRLVLPLGSSQWAPDHLLRAELERPVVPADQPLVLTVFDEFGGPTPLRIRWEDEQGRRDSRIPDAMTGPWRERLTLAPGRYRFDLEWGDARVGSLIGRVVERPGLEALEAELVPPAYTGREAQQLTGVADLAVLAGSTVHLRLRASAVEPDAEQTVSLAFAGEAVPTTLDEDGTISGILAIDRAGEITLALSDRYGEGEDATAIGSRPDPRIPVAILPDRVPHVRLSGPRRNEAVSPQARLDLLVQAQDDIALATLRLLVTVEGGDGEHAEGERELASWPEVLGTIGETQRRSALQVSALAGPGASVVLVAEAADGNDVSGPGIGRSDPLPLRVVSEGELRQELDRNLAEIRDRIIQARDQLAPGLTDAERLTGAARAARPVAERAAEQLRDAIRRWQANGLGEGEEQLQRAVELVEAEAIPRLKNAPHDGDLPEANEADRKLGEAERSIARMLQSGDLVRELRNLLNRQQQVNLASRDFVRANLGGGLDEAARRQQADLGLRQQELADQLREWQRRLLDNDAAGLSEAKDLVRTQPPASGLEEAARQLGAPQGSQRALSEQGAATETMERLLELLAGGEAARELAARIGELAAQQEDLAARLAAGAKPQELEAEQRELEDETRQLAERVENETQNEEAGAALQGAAGSQSEAGGAMGKGQRSKAEREAAAAAAQLRQAQRALGGEEEQQQDEDEQPTTADIVALLRKLKDEQAKIVTECSALVALGVGVDAPLAFADKRKVLRQADAEEEVLLQLQADALSELEDMPIALRALKRVERAVAAAHEHLAEPAMGERGLRLAKIALHEIDRLLRIVDSIPPPKESQQQGQGQGQGQQRQAPFPPAAQLALLVAEQLELRMATAANRPMDLGEAQAELKATAESVAGATRPGTRPFVLMQRAVRAMASASDLLDHEDRGGTTRSEQDAAVAMLYQILAEAEAGQGQSQGSSSSGQQGRQPQGGRSGQRQADRGQGNQQGQGQDQQGQDQQGQETEANPQAQSGSQNAKPGDGDQGSDQVVAEVDEQRWMHLPKAEREKLKEALQDQVPAEGIELFRAYLEVLEGFGP